jgi:4-aminobutyrate aminotransferase-like enzyme/Ser/Thr protein kinase RdoA (MazF antagonist)
MTTVNPFAGHELRPPQLTADEAATAARVCFGIEGELLPLDSHQDRNFRIDAPGGRYVLKIANDAFTPDELDLQNRAMEHVAGELAGSVPKPLAAGDGRYIADAAGRRVRLVTYLDGEPLRDFDHLAPAVLRDAGRLVARVAGALGSFEHPAADRVLQWDVRHAHAVSSAFASAVREGGRRELARRAMERAAGGLEPFTSELRVQVIHGDTTDWNVLARRDPAGRPLPCALIDFGDVMRSWLAADCAVLATSVSGRNPARSLQDAVEVVRGFHSVVPLTEAELAALPALMVARAVISALGGEHQRALEPANRYVTRGVELSWGILRALTAIPPALAHAAFRDACGLPAYGARATPLRAAPGALADELERGRPAPVDLSPQADVLEAGSWRHAAAVAEVVERLRLDGAVPVGRYGERRIVHDTGPGPEEPRTVHLGADIFLPEGTVVRAPLPGRVLRAGDRELLLELRDSGLRLRLAGLVPRDLDGEVAAGDELGPVAAPRAGQRLPAHLHVQLGVEELDELPGLVPASLAPAWLALCPDPTALLGLEVAATGEPVEAALERRRRFVASPQRLYYAPNPPQIERGWRQWLYDVAGRPYLDVINNVAIVGHSHPRVEAAAARQMRRLNTNSRFLYDAMGRFAERLVRLSPDPLDVVFLVNSGSEAGDLALRLARVATGRQGLLCFEGCYHGWTAATNETLSAPPWVHPVTRPHPDPERSLRELVETVDRLVAAGRPPAALLCEPVLGNLGGVVPPAGWLARAYSAVRAAGGLCIADEVQVGYGRVGSHFWAFEQQGVVPDIVTIAKATGNGHPVAAVITTRQIADSFGRSEDLFSSVGGSPVSCEVGIAVLDVLEEERLQDNARRVGHFLSDRLGAVVDGFPIARALHGIGLYRGLELGHEDGRPATEAARAICERILELGVIVQPTGPGANVLKLKPPLCVTARDVDYLAGALGETLKNGW